MHHYPFHPGDYMLSTAHLTLEEDATYRRLLDLYYSSESPIPLKTQSVSRRLRVGSELVARVLTEFFERRETGWHHARCDAEIAKYRAQAERARANGKRGGRPQNQGEKPSRFKVGSDNKPKANPEESKSKANQEPRTKNQEPVLTPNPKHAATAPPSLGDEFEKFWRLYPRREAKADAIKAWRKVCSADVPLILSAIPIHAQSVNWQKEHGRFIPLPASWLNARRWEDELKPVLQSDVQAIETDNEELGFLTDNSNEFHP